MYMINLTFVFQANASSNEYLICWIRWALLEGISIYWLREPLQWSHNERNGVSNHQPHDCLLKRLFRRRSKKISKLRVTGLCAGNSPVSIWWRHHDNSLPHSANITSKLMAISMLAEIYIYHRLSDKNLRPKFWGYICYHITNLKGKINRHILLYNTFFVIYTKGNMELRKNIRAFLISGPHFANILTLFPPWINNYIDYEMLNE